MTPTPTPRTDERANSWESTDGQWVSAEFARWLERELATKSDQLAANHEATKLMGKWLEAERALADRLAGVLLSYDHDQLAGEDMQWLPEHDEALTAWKEARSE